HQAHRVDGDAVHGGRTFRELRPVAGDLAEQLRTRPGRLPFQLGGQRAERSPDVAGQLNPGPGGPVDVPAAGADVNQVALTSLVPEAGFVFDRVVPDGDDHVSRVQ